MISRELTWPIALAACALGASLVLTRLAAWVATRARWLAHPVERSSHTSPTPQVGGVGVCLAWVGALGAAAFWRQGGQGLPGNLALVLVAGLAIGLADDFLALGAMPKLALLGILAALPSAAGTAFHLPILTAPALPGWLAGAVGMAAAFVWILYFTNAFNFMDGVNGQAGFFTIHALAWFAVCHIDSAGWHAARDSVTFLAVGIGAILGFLVWNFPRAVTFLGDSGSLPLGAVVATLAIQISYGDLTDLFPATLLILSPYLYDTIYTLARRIARRENIFQAHRSHLYQRLLIATGWSHARLLAAHLPLWGIAGAAGYAYLRFEHRPWGRGLAIAATCLALGAYTAAVLRREARSAGREDHER